MSENIVALGRGKLTPHPGLVKELEKFLVLAKEGRIRTLIISAEVPDEDNWEDDEIRSRWFDTHNPKSMDYVRVLGVAQNLTTAIGMALYNLGYTPPEDEE